MVAGFFLRKISRLFGYEHLSVEEKSYRTLSLVMIAGITLLDLVYHLTFYVLGQPYVWWTTAAYLLVTGFNFWRLKKGGSFRFFRNTQTVMVILLPLCGQLIHGGFAGSGGVVLAAFLAPLGTMMFASVRTSRITFVSYIAALLLAGFWEYYAHLRPSNLPEGVQLMFFVFNFGFTATIAYLLMEGFLRNKAALLALLREEHQKADNLLLDILPVETAKELKEKGFVKAKRYEEVTVLFTDFVGFSAFARSLTAEELVEQLDFYFRAFDTITRLYGLEKIKTIGDSYMCAGGIPLTDPQHADKVILAALSIREFVHKHREEKMDQYGYPFDIRIGIHTGHVVAGVVGSSKIAYDIWSETVNIAARMEQLCEPGKINISQTAYDLVKDNFHCSYRGRFPAKHVGEIDMFYVEGMK